MGSMERYAKVGMQELDQRLSKVVEAARKRPVSVYRYGAPLVWIVSQEDWQCALKEVSSFIPPNHSLVLARPQIDSLLSAQSDYLAAFKERAGLLIEPATLIHVLLLQVLYSVPSERQVSEQLSYNLLFRWFVGLDLKHKVWTYGQLSRDTSKVLADATCMGLLHRIVGEVFCNALLHMPEFSVNFTLLQTWSARHAGGSTLTL